MHAVAVDNVILLLAPTAETDTTLKTAPKFDTDTVRHAPFALAIRLATRVSTGEMFPPLAINVVFAAEMSNAQFALPTIDAAELNDTVPLPKHAGPA